MSDIEKLEKLKQILELTEDPTGKLLELTERVETDEIENSNDHQEIRDEVEVKIKEVAQAVEDIELLDAEKGDQGERGERGEQGIKGDKGDAGRDGKDGLDGIDGNDGEQGLQGEIGAPGDPGQDGLMGETPDHEWKGTKLRFETSDGRWGKWTDLRGKSGSTLIGSSGKMIEVRSDGAIISSSAKTIDFTDGLQASASADFITVSLDGSESPLTGYLKLAGRTGGQVAYGGDGAGDDLTLYSTSHPAKGIVYLGFPTTYVSGSNIFYTPEVRVSGTYKIDTTQVLKTVGDSLFVGDGGGSLIDLTSKNIIVGLGAAPLLTGSRNSGLGYGVFEAATTATKNQAFGDYALQHLIDGTGNSAIGNQAMGGTLCLSANYTTANGYQAGHQARGDYSVHFGYRSGYYNTRDYTLTIGDSYATDPLIYGEFDTGLVRINGAFNVTGTADFDTIINVDTIQLKEGITTKGIIDTGTSLGTLGNRFYGAFGASGYSQIIAGGQPDDASSVGVIVGNITELTTAGSKLLSVRNSTTEKAYIDYTGGGYFAGNVGVGIAPNPAYRLYNSANGTSIQTALVNSCVYGGTGQEATGSLNQVYSIGTHVAARGIGGRFNVIDYKLDRTSGSSTVYGGWFSTADRTGTFQAGASHSFQAGFFNVNNATGDWTTNNPTVNTYNLYIGNTPTGYGSNHTHYSIYAPSGNNYFGGTLGIGGVDLSYALYVNGTSNFVGVARFADDAYFGSDFKIHNTLVSGVEIMDVLPQTTQSMAIRLKPGSSPAFNWAGEATASFLEFHKDSGGANRLMFIAPVSTAVGYDIMTYGGADPGPINLGYIVSSVKYDMLSVNQDGIVVGGGTAGKDYTLTFDGETNDGVITWMEDEAYFDFSQPIVLPAGTASAGTAPLKFTSGTLMTNAEAGAVEFLTDKYYATTTTGPTRKEIALYSSYYGGMFAYNKAIPFNITVADTYHAFHLVTAGDIVTGLLQGFSFDAGRVVDANITSEVNGTGGKLRIVCSAAHSLVTGDLVVLGSMNNAGHNKPTRITTDGTNPTTEFLCDDITYVAGAGASAGTVDKPACLIALTGSDGVYFASVVIDGLSALPNKFWKFELNVNISAQDNVVTERKTTNTLASMSTNGNIQIAAGDCIWLSGKNITDTSDYTVQNLNINLHRI